ncbi:hypothetical protein RI444_15470 [Paenarthrobacter sp. AT5]|uniref:Gp37-like protein n=1 Tax=Paenarthrobacter TaxID=1742992 RepID=UPI001A993FAA|nr:MULTISPECIES: hypothetical protein [Paenarthrobacter]QSZ53268.1 hypothetical protein AYX19_09800 [Paenarthrobacter ureafaciens]WOC59907.1 hypothetical protein RI444_15470 [Paenarthrobacter sp. AT5]
MVSIFRIAVYDKNRQFRCQIGNPTALAGIMRHNMVSTLDLTVPLAHEHIGELMADGARIKVLFRKKHLFSGPIMEENGESNGVKGSVTFSAEGDLAALKDILGWPVPGSAIDNQGAAEYRTYTGTAEAIVKAAVQENGVVRMGVPGLTVAPNLNRGAVIPGGVPLRMHPLFDQLFPAVETAGLGVTVQQLGTDLVLDVYEAGTYPRTLRVKGRTLKGVKWNRKRPTASRVVIGGQGEGTARNFRVVIDPDREAQYGMKGETFRDARDDNTPTVMDARGRETLDEAGPKNGLTLELVGTGIFQYGEGGFREGMTVPVEVADGLVITQPIREVSLKWVSPEYAEINPMIGEIINQPARIFAQRIAALYKGLRNQERR